MDIVKWAVQICPEFEPSELYADLPTVVMGEFGDFISARIKVYGSQDAVVQRVAQALNTLFVVADDEAVNALETGMFEQLADDATVADVMRSLLAGSAAESFIRIWSWAGAKHKT